ncbi:MAG: AP endonuclease, partial [Desulfuromonas sp.]
AEIGHRIIHLHLHDNTGKGDEHRPVGEGDIDFDQLFSLIHRLDTTPSMTLEAHTLEELDRSLVNIEPFLRRS